MSLRLAALLALAGLTAVTAGCVVEQPPPHPRRVYVEPPPPPPVYEEVVAPQQPPMTVVEVIPAPRPGFVWARGYWHWEGGRYVAVRGHWEAVRPGYHYGASALGTWPGRLAFPRWCLGCRLIAIVTHEAPNTPLRRGVFLCVSGHFAALRQRSLMTRTKLNGLTRRPSLLLGL